MSPHVLCEFCMLDGSRLDQIKNGRNACLSLNVQFGMKMGPETKGRLWTVKVSKLAGRPEDEWSNEYVETSDRSSGKTARKLEDKIFCTKCQQALPDFSLLLISSWIQFWCVQVFLKYLNCSTLPKELFSGFILWLLPVLWSQDMTMYLDLSAFTSSPISLLATTKTSLFSLTVCFCPIC